MNGHVKKPLIIADKHFCNRQSQGLCEQSHYNTRNAHYNNALFKHIFKFAVIYCAVVITDYRCGTYRIAYKQRNKHKLNIHQHSVCRNAVFTGKFHKLKVIYHADDRS